MRAVLALILVAVASSASAEEAAAIPSLPDSATAVAGFAPEGWTVETQAQGDLDGDGRADAAFVLRPNNPAYKPPSDGFRMDADARILGVALASDGEFRLVARNATLIPRHAREGVEDSFEGALRIERGALKVIFDLLPGAGSWHGSRTFTFRLASRQLTMIGFDMSDVQRGPGDITTVSVNYLTGKMSVAKGSIERDKDDSKVWTKLRLKRGPTIEEIGDGVEFDPRPKLGGDGGR